MATFLRFGHKTCNLIRFYFKWHQKETHDDFIFVTNQKKSWKRVKETHSSYSINV